MAHEIDEMKVASDPSSNRILLTLSTDDQLESQVFALHPAMARKLSDDLLIVVARHDLAARGESESGGGCD